jgi:four helix bundle protein
MSDLRHHSLVAWQRADDLFIRVHKLTLESFPALERYGLAAQMRRAAYSVPANIAEGFARRYRGARLNHLNIAESSLAELGYCVHAACRLGYIDGQTRRDLEVELDAVGAPLVGLVRSTRRMPLVIPLFALTFGIAICLRLA